MPTTLTAVALLLVLSTGAHAQTKVRPDPLDARAAVPPVVHRTPPPRPADDPPPAEWRAANERVARIGGWRTYARETLPEAPR